MVNDSFASYRTAIPVYHPKIDTALIQKYQMVNRKIRHTFR